MVQRRATPVLQFEKLRSALRVMLNLFANTPKFLTVLLLKCGGEISGTVARKVGNITRPFLRMIHRKVWGILRCVMMAMVMSAWQFVMAEKTKKRLANVGLTTMKLTIKCNLICFLVVILFCCFFFFGGFDPIIFFNSILEREKHISKL